MESLVATAPTNSDQEPSTLPVPSSVSIVPVHCNEKEPAFLKDGVTELLKSYFDELQKLGCDFCFEGAQSEWTDLPGKYDFAKRGGLFVAVTGNAEKASDVVGCIAIRPLTDRCGEVKRLFLRDSHRRQGIGQSLANTIIEHAWKEGYGEIKLDSLERMAGAIKLYEGLGFQRIAPYRECPGEDHVCMNLLRSAGCD